MPCGPYKGIKISCGLFLHSYSMLLHMCQDCFGTQGWGDVCSDSPWKAMLVPVRADPTSWNIKADSFLVGVCPSSLFRPIQLKTFTKVSLPFLSLCLPLFLVSFVTVFTYHRLASTLVQHLLHHPRPQEAGSLVFPFFQKFLRPSFSSQLIN